MLTNIHQGLTTDYSLWQRSPSHETDVTANGTSKSTEAGSISPHSSINSEKETGDTVTISKEARKLSEETKNSSVNATHMKKSGEEDDKTDPVKEIQKQIQDIKVKLQEAQAKLAQAQSGSGKKTTASPQTAEEETEAALETATNALTDSTEVKTIQAEIEMLNQELMMLNDALREAMQG